MEEQLPVHAERRCDRCRFYWVLCSNVGTGTSTYGECTFKSAKKFPGHHVPTKHKAVIVKPITATWWLLQSAEIWL